MVQITFALSSFIISALQSSSPFSLKSAFVQNNEQFDDKKTVMQPGLVHETILNLSVQFEFHFINESDSLWLPGEVGNGRDSFVMAQRCSGSSVTALG